MEWYYAKDGKQVGPQTEAEFNQLVENGEIQRATLIWNQEMSDWVTYAEFANLPPELPSSLPVSKINSSGVADVWNAGNTLVIRKGALLPCRCVKCNQPSEGAPITKKLSYNQPWVYILILLNLIIMLIVAACTAKKATVDIPVCEFHRAKVKNGVLLSWLFCLGSIAMIIAAIGLSYLWLGVLGVVSLFVGIAVGMTRGRLVYPSKIDTEYVWLKGVCFEYLEELPPGNF